MRPLPVFMYHHINPHEGDLVTITPEIFEKQMRYLKEQGCKTLTIDELTSYINGNLTLKQKAAVVTFDDGWLDNYIYAFPVLEKYKINASVFIITERVEKASEKFKEIPDSIPMHGESVSLVKNGEEVKVALNWTLIKEMLDSGLVEFHSHTKSHERCDNLSEKELFEELEDSKKIIEKRLERSSPYLCWPYGKFNDTALSVAKKIGYKAIFTTNPGVAGSGSNLFAIKRIVVKNNLAWFKKRMLIYTNSFFSAFYLKLKRKRR